MHEFILPMTLLIGWVFADDLFNALSGPKANTQIERIRRDHENLD